MELEELIKVFKSNENSQYSLKMKSYMKGHFEFHGIPSPQRKVLLKPFLKAHKKTNFLEVKKIVLCLWDYPYREGQYAGMELLSLHLKYLKESDISIIENLITSKSWWDTVDWLSSRGAGRYFSEFPEMKLKSIEKWTASGNMWLIRSAIIHQLFYKSDTDHDLLAALIVEQKESKEFFIKKACGWALRQYSKTNPSWVESFIEEHHNDISKLAIKEGLKWIEKNRC
ncbi:MAG: DNA alkylation repair protein [Saprospiraceae bacterium]